MNSTIKMLVTFVTGLGVGVLGTYLVVNTRNQEILDQTLADASDWIKKVKAEQEELCKICTYREKYLDETAEADNERPSVKEVVEGGPYNVRVDYASYYSSEEREQLQGLSEVIRDDDFDNHFAERESPQDDEPIYEAIDIIPEEEFFENEEYAKISLTYYEADDTLSNMQDDIVDDVKKFVGDCLDVFRNSEVDVTYVRNEKEGIDFEITRDNRSYKEVVAGM